MTDTITKTGTKLWANSGDSHFLEPDDLWSKVLPANLAERMPRSVQGDGEETLYVDGKSWVRPMPRMGGISGNVRGEEVKDESLFDISHRPPGARDPRARLADLDSEGIWGEVIYPSLGLWDYMITDRDLAKTAFAAMNDWKLSEVQNVAPDRWIVTASIPLHNVEDGVAEVYRLADIGYHAVFMPLAVPEGCDDWNRDTWEPLWAALAETGLVVSAHLGTEGMNSGMRLYGGPGKTVLNYVETTYGVQRFATKLVASGVVERHPNLKILLSEAGASWIPFAGDRMNEGYRQHGIFNRTKLSLTPKEYLFRNFYCSFQHDISAVQISAHCGYRNALWGSDYPHLEGTFGHTQDTLHELFDGIDDDLRERLMTGTFRELFPHVSAPPTA